MSTPDSEILSEAEAAALIGIDADRLARWRQKGNSPPTIEDGEARYARQDVVRWRERYVVVPPENEEQGGRQ